MEGRGVTNYDVNKPNFNFSSSTTEFDDELMKRNIVSFEQCMIGKGATPQEARRLALLQKQQEIKKQQRSEIPSDVDNKFDDQEGVKERGDDSSDSDSDSDSYLDGEDDDDDEFMAQYRSQRLQQLQQEQDQKLKSKSSLFGLVKHIKRSEWIKEVNEASKQTIEFNDYSCDEDEEEDEYNNNSKRTRYKPVVVYLSPSPSDPDPYPELQMESTIETLAKKYPYMTFLKIHYKDAIPNWPYSNLPTLFVYQGGAASHQLVGLKQFLSDDSKNASSVLKTLETKMKKWGIGLPTTNNDDED